MFPITFLSVFSKRTLKNVPGVNPDTSGTQTTNVSWIHLEPFPAVLFIITLPLLVSYVPTDSWDPPPPIQTRVWLWSQLLTVLPMTAMLSPAFAPDATLDFSFRVTLVLLERQLLIRTAPIWIHWLTAVETVLLGINSWPSRTRRNASRREPSARPWRLPPEAIVGSVMTYSNPNQGQSIVSEVLLLITVWYLPRPLQQPTHLLALFARVDMLFQTISVPYCPSNSLQEPP